MKQLEELEISPTPWSVGDTISKSDGTEVATSIDSAGDAPVFKEGDLWIKIADARLMKAAPKMYKLIYDAMGTCRTCSQDCSGCPNHNATWMQRARDILAEAAGESEVK